MNPDWNRHRPRPTVEHRRQEHQIVELPDPIRPMRAGSLAARGIEAVADVRTAPKSRRIHFDTDAFTCALPEWGNLASASAAAWRMAMRLGELADRRGATCRFADTPTMR
jgi:hypothetical protein